MQVEFLPFLYCLNNYCLNNFLSIFGSSSQQIRFQRTKIHENKLSLSVYCEKQTGRYPAPRLQSSWEKNVNKEVDYDVHMEIEVSTPNQHVKTTLKFEEEEEAVRVANVDTINNLDIEFEASNISFNHDMNNANVKFEKQEAMETHELCE